MLRSLIATVGALTVVVRSFTFAGEQSSAHGSGSSDVTALARPAGDVPLCC